MRSSVVAFLLMIVGSIAFFMLRAHRDAGQAPVGRPHAGGAGVEAGVEPGVEGEAGEAASLAKASDSPLDQAVPGAAEDGAASEDGAKSEAAEAGSVRAVLKAHAVTFRWENTNALDAILAVTAETGLSIDAPASIRSRLSAATITLALEDLEADSALELILMFAGPDLTFSEKDGRLLIHER